MTLTIDSERARDPVGRLHRAYSNPPMPEDVLPEGLVLHSPEYRLFLTLVVAVDYARDADKLWVTARRSHESPGTRYLINPNDLLQRPSHEAERDLRQSGLFAGPDDFRTWITLSRGCDGSHLFVCSRSFHRILRGGILGRKHLPGFRRGELLPPDPDRGCCSPPASTRLRCLPALRDNQPARQGRGP